VLVEVRMRLAGQKVENTLWVRQVDTWDAGAINTLLVLLKAWWIEFYATITTDEVFLTEIVATDQTTETSITANIDGENSPGEQAGGTLPGNCSLTASFRTNNRGRAFRGRNYIVGIPIEQMSSVDTVQSAYVDLIVTAYDALKTQLSDSDYSWVVASRFSGVDPDTGKPIPRVAGVTTAITSVQVVDPIIDSQRRRLTGRGQ